jgi:hypothetical protein
MKTCAHFHTGANGQTILVRHGPGGVEVGHVEPYREGEAIDPRASLVHIQKERGGELSAETVWTPDDYEKCETHYRSSGPAKVNSEAFREGWDAIFRGPSSSRDVN